MPVKVQCSRCNATLELDEGFRGGVCRCGCGALLHVPRSASEGAAKVRPAGPPTSASSPRTSLRPSPDSAQSTLSDPRSTPPPLGGSAGSGLPRPVPVAHTPKPQKVRPRKEEPPPPKPTAPPPLPVQKAPRHNTLVMIILLLAVMILIALAIYLLR